MTKFLNLRSVCLCAVPGAVLLYVPFPSFYLENYFLCSVLVAVLSGTDILIP